jgi:hypothetical protein
MVVRRKPQPLPPVSTAVWTADASASYELSAKNQEIISRYFKQSLIAPNDPNYREVNRKLFVLAFDVSFVDLYFRLHKPDYGNRTWLTHGIKHPYLMHASLAVALSYDHHLNRTLGCRRTVEECYHWSQGLALFNKRLREPIETKDKDPIWGTAAALALSTYSSPDACTPEESWPLKSDPSDLEWFHMSRGKMSLWHMVNPLRPDSIFRVLASTLAHMLSPLPEEGTDGIPTALVALCHLELSSTAKTNPYFNAAHAVSQLYSLPDSHVTIGEMEQFLRGMSDPFVSLLRQKDPVALSLLYLWYRKAGRNIWWVELRARVECPSICTYLRLYHKGNSAVHAFLPGGCLADTWSELDI